MGTIGIPIVRFAYPRAMDPGPPGGDPPAHPSCLIAGCGYVGARLARRLAGERPVRALVRRDEHAAVLRATGVDALVADLDRDLADVAALQRAADGAAIAYLAPPSETTPSDTRLLRFLAGLGRVRPTAVLYMSTTGVYGDTGGASVSERAELAPGSERARRRVAAERIVTDWCAPRRVRCVVLRVPGIYGPDRLPLERLRRGEPALRREDAGPGNRIHVDDLVGACVAALDGAASGAFNVTDGDHASTTEYLLATAELAGLPPPRLVTREQAATEIPPGMLAFLGETRRVDNTRMREVLRVALRYPDLRAGIAASLAEMHAKAGR